MMRSIVGLLFLFFFSISGNGQDKMTVALDGSGQYTSVQAALDAVPEGNTKKITIYIRKGIYREVVVVDARKSFITLEGEDKNNTILTFNNHAGTLFPMAIP
jgi:Pectin methylesterase